MQTIRVIGAVFWLFAVSPSLLAVTIAVQPSSLAVRPGDVFTLNVNVSGATDLYGYQFDFGFNPAVLAAISVTEGAFLATGGPTIFLPGTIDNVGGSITANADILNGPLSGVNGSGNLLDVTFRALAAGSSSEQIFNAFALNSFGQGLTLTTVGSTVTVAAGGAVPEPGTSLLLASGMLGLFAFRRVRPSRRAVA